MSPTRTFGFRYGALRLLLSVLGMGPAFSSVEVDDDSLRVRMGWAFRTTIAVRHITDVRARQGLVGGIGVHGWGGRWLVNGAATGLVTLTIDPPGHASVIFIAVRLRELTVSLEDPDAFLAALGR
jgi:hypothetical protein